MKTSGKNVSKTFFLGGTKMKYQRKRQNRKRKRMVMSLLITFFVFLIVFGLYQMYEGISVQEAESTNQNEINIQRTGLLQEESKQETKIEDMIEEVTRCVVGISKLKNNGSSIFLQDSAQQLGLGSGVIVSENGYIVTNEHVSGAKYSSCYVTLDTGKTYTGNVVWSDSNLDLSIVKINMQNLPYAKLGDSDELRVGQTMYAIGNPIGYEFQRTVTSGIVSAKDRTIKFTENNQEIYMSDLIQTDAGINPGNSGGPLIDVNGNVVGINSIKITSAEGIGFAVPINVIKPIIERYIQQGSFEEATIGIFAYDQNAISYLQGESKLDNGIYVASVLRNGPAEKAGIKEQDILIQIEGTTMKKMNDLKEYIYTKKPGDIVKVTIQRKGKQMEVEVTLGKK